MRYFIQKNRCENTFETNLKERRRKTKTVQNVRLQSISKTHRLGRLKRLGERIYPSTTKWVLNFSKLKSCVKFFKSLNRRIELNKIHLSFIIFQKFRWTVKFRGKTRPFNVLECIKVLFSIPSICNSVNKLFFSAGKISHVNYGQRGNGNLMDRTIPKTLHKNYPRWLISFVIFNYFVCDSCAANLFPSIVFWVALVLCKLIWCFNPSNLYQK